MRSLIAALCVAAVALMTAAAAGAAPTTVDVRIEGRAETLFEGRVQTEPHGVRAASDKLAAGALRPCDGINANDPGNVVPGVVPTAVAADAMALLGETFDGQWYKQYQDYFVTRWGPDGQDVAADAYWGILVNDVFSNVGGCQYQLGDGDEVLWAYDAFGARPTLALFPAAAAYTVGERPRTVTVAPGEAVPLEVVSPADDQEDLPPPAPTRAGSAAFPGAAIAPVTTSAKGFERVETSAPGTVTTDAGGKASVSFGEPGWHRVKATVGVPGLESAIRSNRLDVCVTGGDGAPLEGARGCGELPLADTVRVAPPMTGEVVAEAGDATPAPAPTPAGGTPPQGTGAAPAVGPLRVSVPRLGRARLAAGSVAVSWTVLDDGPGVRGWTISSREVGKVGARWITRAHGTTETKATLHLPRGDAYRLRFAITDRAGATSTVGLGKVEVPATASRTTR